MSNTYIVEHGNSYEGGSVSHADSDQELLDLFDPRSKNCIAPADKEWAHVYALYGCVNPLTEDVKQLTELAAARPTHDVVAPVVAQPVHETGIWFATTRLAIPEEFTMATGLTPEKAVQEFVSRLVGLADDATAEGIEAPLTHQEIIDSRNFVSVSGQNSDGQRVVISGKDARFDAIFDIAVPTLRMR